MIKKVLSEKDIAKRKLSSDKRKIEQKKKYLAEWDEMFERMKSYKADYGKTTVNKDYLDQKLYRWFRKQKLIYNHPTQKLPKEHLEKLNSINFYFGDGHKEQEEITENKWMALLKDAIDSGEKIYTNHRFRYKGQGLGTFLVGVKQANKKGKKLRARKKITALGFELDAHGREQTVVALRFLGNLENNKEMTKQSFQANFNQKFIEHKKDDVPEGIKQAISDAWFDRFGEERTWTKITRLKSADDFINDFVKDLFKAENPTLIRFFPRFKHSILKRKSMFNAEQRTRLSNAWRECFGADLDWDIEIKRHNPEVTCSYFIKDLENKNKTTSKQKFKQRFKKTIHLKRKAISKETFNKINKAWENRFGEKLNWNIVTSDEDVHDQALKFLDDLLTDENAKKSAYLKRVHRMSKFKNHLSPELIKKVNALWKLRFDEHLIWYPKKKLSEEDRIKLWKKFRYNVKKNPKGKWITGPKTMGKLYTWANRFRNNKYALATVAFNFTEDELKEMKREGFLVDINLAKKAKELNI